jgi:hypothetical protein
MRHLFPVMLLATLCSNFVFAQPAEKAAAASSVGLVASATITATTPFTCTAWTKILGTAIKPPGGKDLFIGFSAQTGLFTSSTNNSLGTVTFTLENTGIQVRVLVDSNTSALIPPPGTLATPGALTFDNLIRSTSFQSLELGGADILALVQNEGGVRSFNFIKADVGVGDHTVNVQSRFCTQNTHTAVLPSTASSSLSALIGARTLTVEEVKLDAR